MQTMALIGRNALESRDDFTSSNKSLVSGPLMTMIALILLILTHHMTPVTAASAYVLPGLLTIWWVLRQLYITFRPRLAHLWSSLQLLLRYGLASYGVDLCGAMALYAGPGAGGACAFARGPWARTWWRSACRAC